jgi:acetyl-CoA carboxylase carboxyl transferase subunit alpha
MHPQHLDFEKPIVELEEKIGELRLVGTSSKIDLQIDLGEEIERLIAKRDDLARLIFGSLDDWQIVQVARHSRRPYTLDYIERIFTDFDELHGDRHFGDAPAIVGGIGRLEGMPVMIIGHQKGRSLKEKLRRNFAMPPPEGYRKALRLMEMAEHFKLPLLTFIDTPGAYPGIDAEQRGQSEAIARNLFVMAGLKIPIICTVIGEGGSGGALAIGVGDRTLMLQYSIYSAISPEGCASILWKSAEKAPDAAAAMGMSASRLKALGLIDEVVPEPLGGAHRDMDQMAQTLKARLLDNLVSLQSLPSKELQETRYQRLMSVFV